MIICNILTAQLLLQLQLLFLAGRKVFRSFLRCEYSEENILFWMAVEDLKKEVNPETVEEKARIIYEEFVSILSPREVLNSINYNSLLLSILLKKWVFLFCI